MNAQSTIRDAYDSVFEGHTNLGMGERIVSTGLGLAVAAGGLRKGASIPGAIMGLVGAALVARGMSGHCPVKERLSGHQQDRLGHSGSQGGSYGESRGVDHSRMAETY
ncbi:YgaP family membrane protein [Azospirillum sp. B2RO_4]|uniref:YgaP family membrane protein n=1 Tax=Azospirillum sp. B2RO_4 TaxID=3027796 RepID=UPI003DA8C499